MKSWCTAVAVSVLLAGLASPSLAKTGLTTTWDNGLNFKSEDGNFKVKVGGRIQNDWAWFSQDSDNEAAYGNMQDGTEYRRIRLAVSGSVYGNIVFKAQYDFAGAGSVDDDNEIAVKDMYIGVTKIPALGTIRAGNQYEPMGLEEQTSSKHITFMERSLTSGFVPSRNSGIMFTNTFSEKRGTISAGAFRSTDDGGRDAGDGNYAGTARVTALPVYNKDDNKLVHLGASTSLRNPGSAVRLRLRPSAHLSERLVATPSIDTDALTLFGGEGAVMVGPFSAQGEVVVASLDAVDAGDPTFMSYYGMVSFFLTGESRGYKTSSGLFDRVTPRNNFSADGGSGAWEVAARVAMADLNDGMVTGGELMDITVGVNWYLNPNTRIMLNFVRGEATKIGSPAADTGSVNAFQTRFAFNF